MKLQDIKRTLISKHGMADKEAEAFLQAFADTLTEGITADGQVKINRLGTFKLTEVKQRESVNVNTGERVVIDAHTKLSFTPLAAVKELINKPFAQFETVTLKDGVDIPDTEIAEETPDIEPQQPDIEPQQPDAEPQQPDAEPEQPDAEPEQPKNADDTQTMSATSQTSVEKPEEDDKPANTQPIVEKPEPTVEIPAAVEAKPEPTPAISPVVDTPSTPETNNAAGGKRKISKYLLLALLLLLLIIFALILAGKGGSSSDNAPSEQPADTVRKVNPIEEQQAKALKEKQKLMDEANEKVENLPYKIVDIYDTIKLSKPTTTQSLSYTYGGAGSEIYIRALNGGRQQFNEGDEVLIPIIEEKPKPAKTAKTN